MGVRALPGKVKSFEHAAVFIVQYADGRKDVIVQCRERIGIAYWRRSWTVVPNEVFDCILDMLVSGALNESDDVVHYAEAQGLELFYFRRTDKAFVVTASGRVIDLGSARNAKDVAGRLGPGAEELLKAVGL